MGIRPHTCKEPTGDAPSMFWLTSRVKEKMLYWTVQTCPDTVTHAVNCIATKCVLISGMEIIYYNLKWASVQCIVNKLQTSRIIPIKSKSVASLSGLESCMPSWNVTTCTEIGKYKLHLSQYFSPLHKCCTLPPEWVADPVSKCMWESNILVSIIHNFDTRNDNIKNEYLFILFISPGVFKNGMRRDKSTSRSRRMRHEWHAKANTPFQPSFYKKGALLPFRSLLEVLWLSWWGRHRILERTVGQTGQWQKKAKFKKVLVNGLVIYMQDI